MPPPIITSRLSRRRAFWLIDYVYTRMYARTLEFGFSNVHLTIGDVCALMIRIVFVFHTLRYTRIQSPAACWAPTRTTVLTKQAQRAALDCV